MIVRVASELPLVKIGSSNLQGRELVGWSDNVDFTAYDINLQCGSMTTLSSCFGENYNHVYYCCYGDGEVETLDSKVIISSGMSLSFGGKLTATFKAIITTRLMMVAVKEDAPQSKFLVQKQEHLAGSDRDVDWQHGRSRRHLLASDGFNLTLTSTLCFPNFVSPMTYRNNYEMALYLRGDVTYTWNNGENSHQFKQESCEEGAGCVFLMNNNDAHEVHTRDMECECLCVFSPPLTGTETHDFKSGKPSVY